MHADDADADRTAVDVLRCWRCSKLLAKIECGTGSVLIKCSRCRAVNRAPLAPKASDE